MKRLKTIESAVEKILEIREDTREDDDLLFLCTCEYFHRGVSSMSVKEFFKTRSNLHLPSFVSVVRARRKICERRPELESEKAKKLRAEAEKTYIDYAING
jgi:hypothetical protein